jgi:hypothetical protein
MVHDFHPPMIDASHLPWISNDSCEKHRGLNQLGKIQWTDAAAFRCLFESILFGKAQLGMVCWFTSLPKKHLFK